MKLVRFQDSRVTNIVKKFLLTSLESATQEISEIMQKLTILGDGKPENEIKILDETLNILQYLIQAVKQQIEQINSDIKICSRKKMEMEIEESRFVRGCNNQFSSQTRMIQEEILALMLQNTILSEEPHFEEDFDKEVLNLKSVLEKMYANAISARKKQIDSCQIELYKRLDLMVAEEIRTCKNWLEDTIHDFRIELKMYEDEESEALKFLNNETEKIWDMQHKLQNLYSEHLESRKKDSKKCEEALKQLTGQKVGPDAAKELDMLSLIKPEACFQKLKTGASLIVSRSKKILYTLLEASKTEVEEIDVLIEEIIEAKGEGGSSMKKKNPLSDDDYSKFTENELDLLEDLEQEVYAQTQKVTEFCDQLFSSIKTSRNAFVETTKQLLERLSEMEDGLLLEASKLIHFIINLTKSVYNEYTKGRKILRDGLDLLQYIQSKKKIDQKHRITNTLLVVLSNASTFNKEVIAFLKLSHDSFMTKEEHFVKETSKLSKDCNDLLHKVREIVEEDIKEIAEHLESLKQFGSFEEIKGTTLTKDEKALIKCHSLLLAVMDRLKNLAKDIHLELQLAKENVDKMTFEDSRIFPSWCDRFLAFIDFYDESVTVDTSALDRPTVSKRIITKQKGTRKAHGKLQDFEARFQYYKEILKTLEQKQKQQVSTWDDFFLMSALKGQIDRMSLELEIKRSDDTALTKHQKEWDELLDDASGFSMKHAELASNLKEQSALSSSLQISSWSEIFDKAVEEWNGIVKKEAERLHQENLLFMWKEAISSGEHTRYSSGLQYTYQLTKYNEFAQKIEKGHSRHLEVSPDALNLETISHSQDTQEKSSENGSTEAKDYASAWNEIFSKFRNLRVGENEIAESIWKKSTEVQSQVILASSTWDDLFLRAVDERKADLKCDRKERIELQKLAKAFNEEIHGSRSVKEYDTAIKPDKFENWLKLIYDMTDVHKSDLLNALHIKKSEIEKYPPAEEKPLTEFEIETADSDFVNLDKNVLVDQAKKLLSDAIEMSKKEIQKIESDQKNNSADYRQHTEKAPKSVLFWKLLMSAVLNFKSVGQTYEPGIKKHYRNPSKDLFAAATEAKIKEIENSEKYWKKFGDKRFFTEIACSSQTWSEIFYSISDLCEKDITRMSYLGITDEPGDKLQSEMETDRYSKMSIEELKNSASWIDLVIAALDAEDEENNPSDIESTVLDVPEKETLLSWDEIFFFLNLLCKGVLEKDSNPGDGIYIDFPKLKSIRQMVSSNFFTWDTLITGIIEEMLWSTHNMSTDNDENVSAESKSLSNLFESSKGVKGTFQINTSPKSILKKFGMNSFTELFPSIAGVEKLQLEDTLNKKCFPPSPSKRKQYDRKTLWKPLFPIAVEIWQRKRKTYLNVEDLLSCKDSTENDSQIKEVTTESNDEETSDAKNLGSDLVSLQNLEKVIAYDYIADVDESILEKFPQFKEIKSQLENETVSLSSCSPSLIEDLKKKFRSGDSMNPEYLSAPATWCEVFRAAVQNHKNFVNDAINLKDAGDECLDAIPAALLQKADASDGKKLKFNALNVLEQEITLQELFETVDVLKMNNLVIFKDVKTKDLMLEDAPSITLENLEALKVMESFAKIFVNAYKSRINEKKLLQKEAGKLVDLSLDKCMDYRAYPLISKLLHYLNLAMKTRSNENDLVNTKLESLKDLKSIFSGYLENPLSESVVGRNDRTVKEMRSSLVKFERQHGALLDYLKDFCQFLLNKLNVFLKRRKAEPQLVNLEQISEIMKTLDVQHREIFIKAKKLFSSITDKRNKQVESMKKDLSGWRKLFKPGESIENTIYLIVSNVLNFFEEEMSEHNQSITSISHEKDVLSGKRNNFDSKIASMYKSCKDFLKSAIENRKNEISTITSGLKTVMTPTLRRSSQSVEMMEFCKGYSNKFIKLRKREIEVLEKYLIELKLPQMSKLQEVCLDYFAKGIMSRRTEISFIENELESCKKLCGVVETELPESSDKTLGDVNSAFSGSVHSSESSNKKIRKRSVVHCEVTRNCIDFYSKRKEALFSEIRSMEDNSEFLKLFKADTFLMLIDRINAFKDLFASGIEAIQRDNKWIRSEMDFIYMVQKNFYTKVHVYLVSCKEQFEKSLCDLDQDVSVLKFQLNILRDKDKFDLDDLDASISDVPESFDHTVGSKDMPADISDETADEVLSKDAGFVKSCYDILNSALEFRTNYIDILSAEILSLTDAENKAFQTVTQCTNNILIMLQERESEKQQIEEILLSHCAASKIEIMQTCSECLNSLLSYDTECLEAFKSDCDRLKSTMKNFTKKRGSVFYYLAEKLAHSMDLNENEVEDINLMIATMDTLESNKDADYVSSTKDIYEFGIENRKTRISNIKNALESLKTEQEILPAVNICEELFNDSMLNRKEENMTIEKQIDVLDNEAPIILSVVSPSLEAVLNGNKSANENLVSVVKIMNNIARDLKVEEEVIIEGCQKVYYTMLETTKIEREAIQFDINSLKLVEKESKDVIDTEGKEIIVSFKDLYLTVFNLKKYNLEKDIRKKNVEENINEKRFDIIEILKRKETTNEDQSAVEGNNQSQPKSVDQSAKGEVAEKKDNEKTFNEFVQYYDTKKEKRRLMIEQEIMKDFEDVEINFLGEEENFDIDKYSEEIVEEEEELKTKTRPKIEDRVNRIFEVKMKEFEAEIALKQEKMTRAIDARKYLMNSIVTSKRKKLENNIKHKETEMRHVIDSLKGLNSTVFCSLKDIFSEIIHLKSDSCESVLLPSNFEKFIPEKYQGFTVSVKLDKFLDIALEIREIELQMMLQTKFREIDKIVSTMKREIEKIVVNSKEKLEEELKLYRKAQKAKAMEYAKTGGSTMQSEDYIIKEKEIFPDTISFQKYVDTFKDFFILQPKKVCEYEDITFRSEEIYKNDPAIIPLFKKHIPLFSDVFSYQKWKFNYSVPNQILKVLEVEIKDLMKILSDMNLDKAKGILLGNSSLSAETIVHDASSRRLPKEILLDIVSVLRDSTSLHVLGVFDDKNCDVCFDVDKDCSLVYFEDPENIKKWRPIHENVKEVAVDIGLKDFGKSGCLDDIATMSDWAVTTVPMGLSRFERFISDIGLLEQIKFTFLQLHHKNLFCQSCNFSDLLQDFGLAFKYVLKILALKQLSEASDILPLSCGTPTSGDVVIARYVCRVIILRGAILSAVCLSTAMEKMKKKEVTVITTSTFIRECDVYQKILKIMVSYLTSGKKVNFIFCNKSSCGVGASIMASIANQNLKKNPRLYLLELERRLRDQNRHFSVQDFLKLLSDPELFPEAEQIALQFKKEMKFDLPLAVIWAYNFIHGKFREAENLYKDHHISLAEVSYLVCRKISFDEDLELARMYLELLKEYGAEQSVKENAYKVLFDLLFVKDQYEEAVALVKQCGEDKIPLSKLRHSTLKVLHDFCRRQSDEKGVAPFPMPVQDFDTAVSGSNASDSYV